MTSSNASQKATIVSPATEDAETVTRGEWPRETRGDADLEAPFDDSTMVVEETSDGLRIRTRGRMPSDIAIDVRDQRLVEAGRQLLRRLADLQSHGQLLEGDPLLYGSSSLSCFEATNEALLVCDGSAALQLDEAQRQKCYQVASPFAPPRADQLVVLNVELLNGGRVEGVRYPAPPHMSGWWLMADSYSGDTSELTAVHVEHVVSKRPDLAIYLGMDRGYCFYSEPERVWFDEAIAAQEVP